MILYVCFEGNRRGENLAKQTKTTMMVNGGNPTSKLSAQRANPSLPSQPSLAYPINLSIDHQLLLAIIESSDDSIVVWDKHYNYLYANKASIERIGTTADKVIGKNMRDGLGHLPEILKRWMTRLDAVFASGMPMRVSDTMLINERWVYWESTLSPIRLSDGTIIAVSVVSRDVSEQKMLEKQLIEEQQKFRYLYRTAQIPMYRNRVEDGKVIECNEAMAKLLGYDSIEECLALCRSVDHYVDLNRRKELLERLQKEKDVYGFEVQIRRRDGTVGWVEITAHLNEREGYIEGVQFDITPAKVLNPIERRILRLIVEGKTNKEIAKILSRSVRTIEDHRYQMMHKLGVNNVVDLVQMSRFACLKSEF